MATAVQFSSPHLNVSPQDTCDDDLTPKDLVTSVDAHWWVTGDELVMAELIDHGPVVAALIVCPSFMEFLCAHPRLLP